MLIFCLHFMKINESLSNVSRVIVKSRFPVEPGTEGAIPRYPSVPSRRHATSLRGYSANYRSTAVDAAARLHRPTTTTTMMTTATTTATRTDENTTTTSKAWTWTNPDLPCCCADLENCVRRIRAMYSVWRRGRKPDASCFALFSYSHN